MRRFVRAIPIAFVALAAVARGVAAAAIPAPAQLVQIEAVLQSAGEPGKARLHVDVRIAEGWHVNSHTPSEDYLIPTNVTLDPAASVTAGPARYPDGKLLKFAFSDKPLSVYENRFAVDIPIAWSGGPAPTRAGAGPPLHAIGMSTAKRFSYTESGLSEKANFRSFPSG